MKRIYLTIMALLTLISSVAFAIGNLTDVRIYDRNENRTLPVYWHEGKAYIVGKPGNEYQIMLRNRVGVDVLGVVSVDGVNVVTGETAAASQGGYVFSGGAPVDIKGWRKSLSRTAAFYFTELTDSYAARTGRPENVGVIGVAVFRRKVPEAPASIAPSESYNSYEPKAKRSAPGVLADSAEGATAQAQRAEEKSLGTGHGRNETSYVRQVDFERATTAPEEIITIYYDSRANLVARGVIRHEPLREPQPFPARFVVDPPGRW